MLRSGFRAWGLVSFDRRQREKHWKLFGSAVLGTAAGAGLGAPVAIELFAAIDGEIGCAKGIDVSGQRAMVEPGLFASCFAWVSRNGHGQWLAVPVDSPVLDFSFLIPTPMRLTRDAETRVHEHQHSAATRF